MLRLTTQNGQMRFAVMHGVCEFIAFVTVIEVIGSLLLLTDRLFVQFA